MVPYADPAVLLGTSAVLPVAGAGATAAGLLKSGVLNRLKNSARSCRFFDSVSWKFLKTEKSMFLVPGPCRMLRPEFPHCPLASEPVRGMLTNAEVLNHSFKLR